jgi:hypothetical protein|tara:strand:+ start:109 stop:558 length:450 start_codon:yes stop_codon:yes gene_type:complete
MTELNVKLEQYRIYATDLYSFENRSQLTSRLYITLNTVAISVIMIASDSNKGINITPSFIVALSVFAMLFCTVWGLTLRSITKHTSAKHIVIQNMEKDLPFKPYTDEWFEHLSEGKGYIRTTILHELFPWIFFLLYASLALYTLVDKFT